jgi:hypothetical protein
MNLDRPLPVAELPTSSLDSYAGVCEIGFRDEASLVSTILGDDFYRVLEAMGEFAEFGVTLASTELLLDG